MPGTTTTTNPQLANLAARTAAFIQSFDPWVLDTKTVMADQKAKHAQTLADIRGGAG